MQWTEYEYLPLFDGVATRQCGNWPENSLEERPRSIYFGIGLTGAKELSPGLPIDVFSQMFMAEYARRKFGGNGKVYILLADAHAIGAGRPEDEVRQKTIELEKTLTTVCSNLELSDFEIIKATDLLKEKSYRDLLSQFADEFIYDQFQWTDYVYMNREKQVGVKVSWARGGLFNPGVRDERVFDIGFQERRNDFPLSYIYVQSGRTFDPDCPRSAPYLTKVGQPRLLLTQESNAITFLDNLEPALLHQMRSTTAYLGELTKLFEIVIAPLRSECLGERLQAMLDMAFGR